MYVPIYGYYYGVMFMCTTMVMSIVMRMVMIIRIIAVTIVGVCMIITMHAGHCYG